ncbi:CHAT domain-containing protein [Leptothoe spongobia]|uniref:CHAT domain-containing protein n=1 Tax=Leptothoe spongobia TAU-MAC 1115 TaxID=1967444 RepID=A0A947DH15_9CYAN|nr:CHAT domain-containing protein [Leptothoe spongobia]MBT9316907.1 CHAT domain-containing protein [Leptothoe spongobia TAU-MAC 1115]
MLAATIALLDASVAALPNSIVTPPVLTDQLEVESLEDVSYLIEKTTLGPTDPAAPLFSSRQAESFMVAQAITPALDGTGTQVNQQGNQIDITAGTAVDQNLFHSFDQFELDAGQWATFFSSADIQNILARVVGGDLAVINGALGITGSEANLYLINPAGIIFGQNAILNLPASLMATSADGIGFGGSWFNALADNDYALLTGEPDALLFSNEQSGPLINTANLAVNPGETLALVGGSVVSTGSLSADNGQVVVQSVTGEKIIQLRRDDGLLTLEVEPLSEGPTDNATGGLTLLSLPELLTGGNDASAIGITVAADGAVNLIGSNQPLLNGDIVADRVEAGTTTLTSANNAYIGDVTTQTSAGGGPIIIEAINDIQVGGWDGPSTSSVLSNGGEIFVNSQQGNINTQNSLLNSSASDGQRGGDITLQALGDITAGDIVAAGGDINIYGIGSVSCSFFTVEACSIERDSNIDLKGTLDSTLAGQQGGNILIQGIGSIAVNDIFSGGGDIFIRSVYNFEGMTPEGINAADYCQFGLCLTYGGDIDTRDGHIDSTNSGSRGGDIALHAMTDISTADIKSGGGGISVFSQTGTIDTHLGILDSHRSDHEGGNIDINGGDIVSSSIRSGGGDISLNAFGLSDAPQQGNIDTQQGRLDSSSTTSSEGGDILFTSELPITTGDVVSGGGDITLQVNRTALFGEPGIYREGTIDARFSEANREADGHVSLNAPNLGDLSSNNPPDDIVVEPDKFEVVERFGDGPSPGDPPVIPPIPSSFAAPKPLLPGPPLPPVLPLPPDPPPLDPPPTPGFPPVPTPNIDVQRSSARDDEIELQADNKVLNINKTNERLIASRSETHNAAETDSAEDSPNQKQTSEGCGTGEQAIGCLAQQLTIARSNQDLDQERWLLGQLGNQFYLQGDYNQAIQHYEQRIALVDSQTDPLETILAMADLAATYSVVGAYLKAEDYYQQGLTMAQLLPDSAPESYLLNSLGMVYYAQRDYDRAIETQHYSLKIAQADEHTEQIGKTLNQLGLAYYAKTNYAKAIELQQQSLEIAQSLEDPQETGQVLENLGLAYYGLQDFNQAIVYHQKSLAIAQELGDRHGEARALTNLGDALYQAEDNQAAAAHLVAAIEIWESFRQGLGNHDLNRISIFETQETTYSTLQQVLVEAGQYDQALEFTERGRARAFVELLNRGGLHQGEQTVSPLERVSDTQAPDLRTIQAIARAQNATLVSYTVIKDVDERQGTRTLKDNEIYIWVVQPNGTVDWRHSDLDSLLGQDSSLSELIQASRCFTPSCWGNQRPIEGSRRSLNYPLLQLHQLLIDPIADLLPPDPNANVVFIPHDDLFLVPFAALQNEKGEYLIEHHTLRTAPSIQVLEFTRRHRLAANFADNGPVTPLVVGNPIMPAFSGKGDDLPWQLSPLPGAEVEAKAIAKLFQTDAIIGSQATEENVVEAMEQASTIHLATHGLLDYVETASMPGAIALTPGEHHDGLLTTQEIMKLDLNAALVVLSACNTGRGRINSDGVVGLSRALISTGVPRVVVSLWQVPDVATQDLMLDFYQQLQQTSDTAQALRQAMIMAIDKHPNPVNWAAFTLVGEGG